MSNRRYLKSDAIALLVEYNHRITTSPQSASEADSNQELNNRLVKILMLWLLEEDKYEINHYNTERISTSEILFGKKDASSIRIEWEFNVKI